MRLITAHKILIGSAVALFVFFGLFEVHSYASSGSLGELASGIAGLIAAAGFALYLRSVYARAARQP